MSEQARQSIVRKALIGIAVLGAICLASGTGVGALYIAMSERIERNEREVFYGALDRVFLEEGAAEQGPPVAGDGGARYSTVGEYDEKTSYDEMVYAYRAPSGMLYAGMGTAQGYSSTIKVLVSVREGSSADPEIHRVAVVSSQETPGLGENIKAVERKVSLWGALAGHAEEAEPPKFLQQFSGKPLSALGRGGSLGEIDAVTGATISSRAATAAVRDAVNGIIERTGALREG